MILWELKRDVSARSKEWAKKSGVEPKNGGSALSFTAPPPHVPADLCLPWPLQAAKTLKRNPLDVAQELAAAFQGLESVDAPQATPPGFVNFRLTPKALGLNLRSILAAPGDYGVHPLERPRSVLIEFVSANPTGPVHLASGRAATLGDSLGRILRRIGHKVWTESYINDAGRQVELLGLSVKAWYDHLHQKTELRLPEDGYRGDYVRTIAEELGKAPAAAGWEAAEFGRRAVEIVVRWHQRDVRDFGVTFDRWFLESSLHQSGALQNTLEFLKSRGMVYEKDGAVWLGTAAAAGAQDDKDRVLIKSDKRPTYFLADIAYHKDKFDRGWAELIDILGADHHGYVPRMKAAIAAMGRPPECFHPIIHQLVHLYRGKELVKMSKRAGEFVTLQELVQEVGRDACRFFFAMRTPNSHMNFDLELAKKRSQENPVYYVQYVHARICSIFKEAAKSGLIPPKPEGIVAAEALGEPEERALLVKLAWFPEVLSDCEEALSPHPLPTYLLELAGLFHPFYEKCRVADPENKDVSAARLALCDGVRTVIKEGLSLLGVSAPESM